VTQSLLGFAAAFALIFLRVPIATSLALVGFVGYAMVNGLPQSLFSLGLIAKGTTLVYSLSVLPLFILMGNLVAGAGISHDLFRAGHLILGRLRGGLAIATVAACAGFGAICGSSAATAATMAKVSVPPMRQAGYADRLAVATVAAGGTLGILIPPSIIMVVYGVSTMTHIGMLFVAGIVPGIVAVLGYVLAVKWVVWRDPEAAPLGERVAWTAKLQALRGLWPVLVLFGLVMGGLYGGWFTATEAGGIGATGAFVFALFHHELKLRDIGEILVDTALTSASLMAIFLGAAIFGEFVNQTGVHDALLGLVQGSGLPSFGIALIIIAIYMVMGCVLESISIILLTIPVFFPIIVSLGYDPIWFGVIIVVATEIGLITPPIGVNLFVIRSIIPDVTMGTLLRGILPFIIVDFGRILLLAAVPEITLWLPRLLF